MGGFIFRTTVPAALPAELPHGAGRGVGGLLVGSVGGAGAVKVAVGQVIHLEDLPQGGVGDVDAEAAHPAQLEDVVPQCVEEGVVDVQPAAEGPVGEGLALPDGLVHPGHDGLSLLGELLLDMGGVEGFQQLGAQKPEQPHQQEADEA